MEEPMKNSTEWQDTEAAARRLGRCKAHIGRLCKRQWLDEGLARLVRVPGLKPFYQVSTKAELPPLNRNANAARPTQRPKPSPMPAAASVTLAGRIGADQSLTLAADGQFGSLQISQRINAENGRPQRLALEGDFGTAILTFTPPRPNRP
jgi:hypothetical protein